MNVNDIKTKVLTNAGNPDAISKILEDNFTSLCLNQSLVVELLDTLDVDKNLTATIYLCRIRSKGINSSTTSQLKSYLSTLSAVVDSCQKNPSKLDVFKNKLSEVFVLVANLLCKRNQAKNGIVLMCNTIKLLQNSSSNSTFTLLHSPLCQLCIKSRNLKPAIKYLDTEICLYKKEPNEITSRSYLSFYYYGGLIYAMLKQYDRSLYFFEQAITVPAVSVSQIMSESYKRYMLVSLLYKGKVADLPKYTSAVMINYIKQSMNCYTKLNEAFQKRSIASFEEVFYKYENTFQQDKNVGLINQVKGCITLKKIQILSKTYSTLPLNNILERAQLNCSDVDLEKKLSKMIKKEEIVGKIDQKNKMMVFHPGLNCRSFKNDSQKADDQKEALISLNCQIEEMNSQLLINPLIKRKTIEPSLSRYQDHNLLGIYNCPSSSTPGPSMLRNGPGGK